MSDIENGRRPSPASDKLDKFIEVLEIQDKITFLDLAAQSRAESKNGIPKDIYSHLKENPESWPKIRQLIEGQFL